MIVLSWGPHVEQGERERRAGSLQVHVPCVLFFQPGSNSKYVDHITIVSLIKEPEFSSWLWNTVKIHITATKPQISECALWLIEN